MWRYIIDVEAVLPLARKFRCKKEILVLAGKNARNKIDKEIARKSSFKQGH
jgi:hypothetical protein